MDPISSCYPTCLHLKCSYPRSAGAGRQAVPAFGSLPCVGVAKTARTCSRRDYLHGYPSASFVCSLQMRMGFVQDFMCVISRLFGDTPCGKGGLERSLAVGSFVTALFARWLRKVGWFTVISLSSRDEYPTYRCLCSGDAGSFVSPSYARVLRSISGNF